MGFFLCVMRSCRSSSSLQCVSYLTVEGMQVSQLEVRSGTAPQDPEESRGQGGTHQPIERNPSQPLRSKGITSLHGGNVTRYSAQGQSCWAQFFNCVSYHLRSLARSVQGVAGLVHKMFERETLTKNFNGPAHDGVDLPDSASHKHGQSLPGQRQAIKVTARQQTRNP